MIISSDREWFEFRALCSSRIFSSNFYNSRNVRKLASSRSDRRIFFMEELIERRPRLRGKLFGVKQAKNDSENKFQG